MRILFLFIFLTLIFSAQAQVAVTSAPISTVVPTKPNSFSDNNESFLKEMDAFAKSTSRADIDKLMKEFGSKFVSGFTPDEQKNIIHTSQLMKESGMNFSPFFFNYLKCLVVSEQTTTDINRIGPWANILDTLLSTMQNRQFEPIRVFLDFSKNFLEKNSLFFGENKDSWFVNNKSYKWNYVKGYPSLQWNKVNLICAYKNDSISIVETKGTFFPLQQQWKGDGGKVFWQSGDSPKKGDNSQSSTTYAKLSKYVLDLTKGFYHVEKATLHYPAMFSERDIEGVLEDRINVKKANEEPSYPRFESYDKRLKMNNIGGSVQLIGGLRLEGTTFYAIGNSEQKAQLTTNSAKTGERNFKALSESFVVRKNQRIFGERVETTLYFGTDSLYHPSLDMRLDLLKNEIILDKGSRGSDQSPFYDSYHKTQIISTKATWLIDRDTLVFGQFKPLINVNNQVALVESNNFYTDTDFRRFQNVSSVNPVASMKIYADKTQKRLFDADELVRRIDPKLDATSAQSMLYDMASQGFLKFDPDNKTIELKDKIFLFNAAQQKKIDYDILRFVSDTKSENAVFHLSDKNLYLFGVKIVDLSSKQKVRASPTEQALVLKKNRDFDFDGRINAGMTVFTGKKFNFEYAPFTVQADSVRYFDLYLATSNEQLAMSHEPLNKSSSQLTAHASKLIALPIASRIERFKGKITIDTTGNMCGLKDYPRYPILETQTPAYIFYDAPETQDSCYKRDSFFFKLQPFILEGLDSMVRQKLTFKGELNSFDIMPPFNETAILQPDSSLGFITQTHAEGISLYRKRGNFNGKLTLNNKGLLGDGYLSYLSSATDSKDIIFRPKELWASADNFNLKEKREQNIPEVLGKGVKIHWKPYNDSMYITAKENAFKFFKEGEHTLTNLLILTPEGAKGNGTFSWKQGTLKSKKFDFGTRAVHADTMDMNINAVDKAVNANQLAFDTRNVKGDIDFDKYKGRFEANSEDIETNMPTIHYKTSINRFDWDLKNELITFDASGKEATFLCTDAIQDSLKFNGKTADYNLKTNILNAFGVPFVRTCDAFVFPDSNQVQIETGGKMATFNNARIVCDTSTQYHVINKAVVTIKGKKAYEAKGFYEYNLGKRVQEIKFDNIVGNRVGKGQSSEKKTETRGFGDVLEADNFFIDEKTTFKGKITLASTIPRLLFEGFAKLQLENLPDKQFFNVNFYGDKKDLAIAFNTPKNENGEPLSSGIFISKENSNAYPRIMMPLTFRKDRAVIDVKGVLKYYPSNDVLKLGDSLKIDGRSARGTYFEYNNRNSKIIAEGRLGICSALTGATVFSYGRAKTNFLPVDEVPIDSNGIKGSPLTLDVFAGINMLIPEKVLKFLAADLASGSFDAADIDYKKDSLYEHALSEFIPEGKDLTNIINDMKAKTLIIPDRFNKFEIVLSKIPMKWNSELQSFVSSAKKVEVQSVLNVPINKQFTALVEFKMPSNEDDRVYLYFKTANDIYYFFGYQKGILSITSSNTRAEEEFNKLKPKEKIKTIGDTSIEIQWVEGGTADLFVRRVANAQK